MEKREYLVYSFGELPKDARVKAVEKYRHINVEETEWYENIYEDFAARLKKLGYEDVKPMFSGFSSQGDGACFTASIDVAVWLRAHKLAREYGTAYKTADQINARIVHTARYYYATSSTVYVDVSYGGLADNNSEKQQEKLFSQMQNIEDEITKERERLGNELYKELERYYEVVTSDIEVEATLQSNDYNFTIDGEID